MINKSFIFALNKILKYNEGSLNRLKLLAHKSFFLNIAGLPLKGIIDIDGLILPVHYNQALDIEIFVPLESAKYLIEQDKLGFFQQIKIHGDKKIARELLEIFSNLHLNGVYNTKSLAINILINKFIKTIKIIVNLLKLAAANTTNSLTEYLLYQTEDLVTHHEINEFYNGVDELKGQVDILQQRIDLLLR